LIYNKFILFNNNKNIF